MPTLLATLPSAAIRSAPVRTSRHPRRHERRRGRSAQHGVRRSPPARPPTRSAGALQQRPGLVDPEPSQPPARCAAMITANAVPSPADTSAPVLQCVRILARCGIRARPCLAMATLAAASSAAIDSASARAAGRGAGAADPALLARRRRAPAGAPAQVHRGRPGVLDRGRGGRHVVAAARRECHAEGAGDPQHRGAADHQRRIASTRDGTSMQVTVASRAGSRVWSSSTIAGPSGGSSQRSAGVLTTRVCAGGAPVGERGDPRAGPPRRLAARPAGPLAPSERSYAMHRQRQAPPSGGCRLRPGARPGTGTAWAVRGE